MMRGLPPPPENLDELAGHILTRLQLALPEQEAAWRRPMLATVTTSGAPSLRTVILRGMEPEKRLFRINADRRSDKIGEMTRSPAVALGFWDPAAREQLRVYGRASVLTDGDAVDADWTSITPEARRVYLATAAPGTPISRPGPGLPPHLAAGPLTHDNTAEGRAAFTVIQVTWEHWDWLWLGPDSHWRARFHWSADGACTGRWVAP